MSSYLSMPFIWPFISLLSETVFPLDNAFLGLFIGPFTEKDIRNIKNIEIANNGKYTEI